MKEKVTCGSHTNKLKKITQNQRKLELRIERETETEIFFFFSSLTSLFDRRKSNRQNSSRQEAKGSTRRGLRVGTKNTRFHRVFNKNSENHLFWLFSDLRLSAGQNWSEQKVKLIHASRATHGYQNIRVSSNSTRYGFLPK